MTRATIDITVSPKSSRSTITIDENNSIKVYLNAPPAEGKANKECILLFSKKLRLAKSNITIEKGEKGRNKKILIKGLSFDEVMEKLKNKDNK
ncbi:MAG: YggU family protein [bacterium]|nr:YggU family protein [bacterium]